MKGAWAGLVLLSVLWALPAAAQTEHTPTDAELAEARHSFDVATTAFEAGDYETAVSEFRAALELSGAADLYFNIYLSEERQGHLQEAADSLDQYLQNGMVDDEQRHLLTGRLERLRARIASHAPAPAVEEQQQTLLASPIAVTGPPPVEVADAAQQEATPPMVTTTSPGTLGIALVVAAGVLAANFGVFAGLAYAENDRLTGTCGHGCLSSQVATLNTYDIVGDVSWIAAAVLGATGIALMFAMPDTHEEPAPIALAPWVSPTSAGVVIGGRL